MRAPFGHDRERQGARSPTGAAPDARLAVLVERVRLLESNTRNIVLGTCVCAACVAVLLDGRLDRAWLWGWLAALFGLSGWRLWTVLSPGSGPVDADVAHRRLRLATVHASLSGGLWGLLGHVAVSAADPVATLVAAMTLTGLVGGATAVVSHLPRVYRTYTFLIVAPAVAGLALTDGPAELRGVAAMLVLYLLFSWGAARMIGRAVTQSIELRLRNADLVHGLTDAQELAAALQRRTADALENERLAHRAKSRFLAAASHDLSQPLHSLRMRASTLRMQAGDGPLARTADGIEQSAVVLGDLFGAILDLSQLDAGTLEANRRPVRLDALLARLEAELRPVARERGLGFEVDPTDACVDTDPVMLERVLRNLLGNALRYTERGAVRLGVGAGPGAPGPAGDRVRLRVIDTGPGIPIHQRERVFEEFVQLERPAGDEGLEHDERDRGEGIGLGLSIVRRMSGLLDVRLALGDTPGGGTTIELDVPRGVDRRRRDGTAAPRRETAADERTLLVIDDEASVRDAMALYLEERGCTVVAVGSGAEALEVLDEIGRAPDGIVCDYRLRGGERGTDAIARVRARCGANVPALLVTGDADVAERPDVRDGGLPLLTKPCDPVELLSRLDGPSRTAIGRASGRPGRRIDDAPSGTSARPIEAVD